jgi:alanine dehydrogenase
MVTLLLNRQDVAALLTLDECIAAAEEAFKLHAEGKALPPKVLGIYTQKGGFHIKAGILNLNKTYFAAKINSNFQYNMSEQGLPLIQGVIVVCDWHSFARCSCSSNCLRKSCKKKHWS